MIYCMPLQYFCLHLRQTFWGCHLQTSWCREGPRDSRDAKPKRGVLYWNEENFCLVQVKSSDLSPSTQLSLSLSPSLSFVIRPVTLWWTKEPLSRERLSSQKLLTRAPEMPRIVCLRRRWLGKKVMDLSQDPSRQTKDPPQALSVLRTSGRSNCNYAYLECKCLAALCGRQIENLVRTIFNITINTHPIWSTENLNQAAD